MEIHCICVIPSLNSGTRVGFREQFSYLIYLFLGTWLANFSWDTKFPFSYPNVFLDLVSW